MPWLSHPMRRWYRPAGITEASTVSLRLRVQSDTADNGGPLFTDFIYEVGKN